MSAPSPYSLTAFILSTAPMNCSCPSPGHLEAVHEADADDHPVHPDPFIAVADVQQDDIYSLLAILPCYLNVGANEDSHNLAAVHQLLDALRQALDGLPCHVHAGLGGAANGEVRFHLHDGREVRLMVVEPVNVSEAIISAQV